MHKVPYSLGTFSTIKLQVVCDSNTVAHDEHMQLSCLDLTNVNVTAGLLEYNQHLS